MQKSMKRRYSMAWWVVCGLGAVDGLAVGFVAEGLRLMYERYRIEVILREAAQRNQPIGYLLNPAMDLLIPIICLVTFTVITHLVYRYLIGRPRSLLLLWTATGGVAVAAGYFMTGARRDPLSLLSLVLFASVSYIIFRLWRDHPGVLSLQWQVIGVSTVLALAAGSQIVGLFVVQRVELRQPLTWLLCLVLVLLVNFIYGALLRRAFSQQSGNTIHVYD
jgi:hypothetical protein